MTAVLDVGKLNVGYGDAIAVRDLDLRVERGAGKHVDRPAFASYYDAVKKQIELSTPRAVQRP